MHRLIGRLVATVGGDRSAADKADGIILPFRRQHDAVDDVAAGIDRLHGARAKARRSQISWTVDGISVGIGFTAAGARSGAIPASLHEAGDRASQKVGADAVGKIAGAVPGRFV
jgi:hypothetical protein